MKERRHKVGDLLYHGTCGVGIIIEYDPKKDRAYPYLTWWASGGTHSEGPFETRGNEYHMDAWKFQLIDILAGI